MSPLSSVFLRDNISLFKEACHCLCHPRNSSRDLQCDPVNLSRGAYLHLQLWESGKVMRNRAWVQGGRFAVIGLVLTTNQVWLYHKETVCLLSLRLPTCLCFLKWKYASAHSLPGVIYTLSNCKLQPPLPQYNPCNINCWCEEADAPSSPSSVTC